MDESYRKPYPFMNRWFDTCINLPEFQMFYKDFSYCETPMEAIPSK